MAPVLVWLILTLCLLISVIKYTLALILKWSVPGAKIQKDYAYLPTVSVLMPCYNEGKTVYETIESISKSSYPNDRFEVIAQDDCSADDSYQWMLKAQRDFTNIRVRVGRNDENSGKARTVCNALQHSTGEIIISIDSDCIFHPDAIRELPRLLTAFYRDGSNLRSLFRRAVFQDFIASGEKELLTRPTEKTASI